MKCNICGRDEAEKTVGKMEIYRYYPEADKKKNVEKLDICKDCDIELKKKIVNTVEEFKEEKSG